MTQNEVVKINKKELGSGTKKILILFNQTLFMFKLNSYITIYK